MPRIRTLKPEVLSDEKLAPLPVMHRFVFKALILLADDAGRLIDNVKTLDGQIFPETDESCGESLDVLAALGRIHRYTAPSGQKVIQLTGWGRHQKVDHPAKFVLPPAPAGEPHDTLATPSRESRAPISTSTSTNDQGAGSAARASVRGESTPGEQPDARPPSSTAGWVVTPEQLNRGVEALVESGLPPVAKDSERPRLKALMREHGPDLVLAAIPALQKHPAVTQRGEPVSTRLLAWPGMLAELAALAERPAGNGGGGERPPLPAELVPAFQRWTSEPRDVRERFLALGRRDCGGNLSGEDLERAQLVYALRRYDAETLQPTAAA